MTIKESVWEKGFPYKSEIHITLKSFLARKKIVKPGTHNVTPNGIKTSYSLEVYKDKDGNTRGKLTIQKREGNILGTIYTDDNRSTQFFSHNISSQTFSIGPENKEIWIMDDEKNKKPYIYRRIWYEPES